jgi:hypothetical protein
LVQEPHGQHRQRQLLAGPRPNRFGHSRGHAPRPVLGPLFRKVMTYVNNGMFYSCHVTHEDTYLAVVNFTQPTAPLPGDPTDWVPFLGNAEGSNTITPSAYSNSWPTCRAKVVSIGR